MRAVNIFLKSGDGRLFITFLVIMAAFVFIMAGMAISHMWICKMALIFLVGALLYIPLWNRLFMKRKNEKTD